MSCILGATSLMVLGCGGGGSPSATASATAPASASVAAASTGVPTPTADSVDAEIIDAYKAEVRAFLHASGDPAANPQDPLIAQTMTGNERANVTLALIKDRQAGLVGRGEVRFGNPVVVSKGPDEAILRDCRYSTSFKYSLSTGQPVPPNQVATHEAVTATLLFRDGAWKVSDVTLQSFIGDQTCPPGF